ncbi:hypothetical protein BDQ12DRAFT_406751 [Crucibulum laeve]|uniref:DUF6534 domain-containing protein n=1 Tax=Crucibulum laeve TaxID=68775 RepID=A0A5C3LLI2_9AGAR|nr:hypothetical protein BDQ12DRAFT_406751 [Crucibulum laeve]
MADIARTFGALLVGGIVAAVFSGIVTVQAFVYFKFYPRDLIAVKLLVFVVWFLDFGHTIFVSASIWDHLISHFGDAERIDFIPWSLALTIAFTAILTFLVHGFFVHRIYKLSNGNIYLVVPLGILVCARLAFACVTTVKMITLKSLQSFVTSFTWSFTIGLTLSAIIDVLITACLFFLLRQKQKQNTSLNDILDSLILYAFENGSLTCAATVISLICWLAMPENLIFMGLHFVISKFYANSLLATLNTRKQLSQGHSRSQPSTCAERIMPIMFPDDYRMSQQMGGRRFSRRDDVSKSEIVSNHGAHSQTMSKMMQLQVNVETTTICTIDEGLGTSPDNLLP